MNTKPLSRSRKLIAEMDFAALAALSGSSTGSLSHKELMVAIEANVPLDDWALEVYEGSGNTRWRSIFAFCSVGLVKAEYVTKSRAVWTITSQGRESIKNFDPYVFLALVDQKYRKWKDGQLNSAPTLIQDVEHQPVDELDFLPEIKMREVLTTAHESLAAELIDTIKKCDPTFFENLVVQLMLAMGYGGSRQEAGRAVGRSGDGGIDGIISEDRLGLDAIYLQAKRWEGSVGEGPIRDFKGALDAKGAHKGVFITTSSFTSAAIEAAKTSRSYKIVLIDGARLAELMIEHNLGVSVQARYELKRIDTDFFSEE